MTVQLTKQQRAAARRLIANRATINPQLLDPLAGLSTYKHDLAFDFGYPRTSEVTFGLLHELYRRHGIARALVERTAGKVWQEHPVLREDAMRDGGETRVEREVRQHFDDIRLWQTCREVDKRALVGRYAGLILQLGDGATYDQPVGRVPGGVRGLVAVHPAWEGQLSVSEWDTDPMSPTYGSPRMFLFSEAAVDGSMGRAFAVHPDRCIVWSEDGTVACTSKLEPCINALLDLDKIRGAGGEGFWKNAKSQPALKASEDVDFVQLAAMLGTDLEGLPDALDDVIAKWAKGFDASLVLQGMDIITLPVTLPQPEQFAAIALQEIAASWPIPQKTLIGMQTGERASTEDAREWAQTCMSHRENVAIPAIMSLVARLERCGVLPERDWHLEWADLTAPTLGEKLDNASKMAAVNQMLFAIGELAFTEDEIRDVAGYPPQATPDYGSPPGDDV